jgi:hypothetical protein
MLCVDLYYQDTHSQLNEALKTWEKIFSGERALNGTVRVKSRKAGGQAGRHECLAPLTQFKFFFFLRIIILNNFNDDGWMDGESVMKKLPKLVPITLTTFLLLFLSLSPSYCGSRATLKKTWMGKSYYKRSHI